MDTRAEQILNIMKENTPSTMPTFEATAYESRQQPESVNDPVLAEHLCRKDAADNLPERLLSGVDSPELEPSKVEQIVDSFQEAVPMEIDQDVGASQQEEATQTSLPEPTTAEGFVGIGPESDRPLAANVAKVQELRESEYQLPRDQRGFSETTRSLNADNMRRNRPRTETREVRGPNPIHYGQVPMRRNWEDRKLEVPMATESPANIGTTPWEEDVAEKAEMKPKWLQQFETRMPAPNMQEQKAEMGTGQFSDQPSLGQSQLPRAGAPTSTMPKVDVGIEDLEGEIAAGGLGDGSEQVLAGTHVERPAKVEMSESKPVELSDSMTQTGFGDGNEQVSAGRSAFLQGASGTDRKIQGERQRQQGEVEIPDAIARKGLGDGTEQVPQGGSGVMEPRKADVEDHEPGFVIPVPHEDAEEWFEVSELGGDEEGAPISQRLGISGQAPLTEKVDKPTRTAEDSFRGKLMQQGRSSSAEVPEGTGQARKHGDLIGDVSQPQDIKEVFRKENLKHEQQQETGAPSNLQSVGEKSDQPGGKTAMVHGFRENVEELKEKVAVMAAGIRESLPNPFARTTGIQARKQESSEEHRARQAQEEEEDRGYEDVYQSKVGAGNMEPPLESRISTSQRQQGQHQHQPQSDAPWQASAQQEQSSDASVPSSQAMMRSAGETKDERESLAESITDRSKDNQGRGYEQVASAQESVKDQGKDQGKDRLHVTFAETVFPASYI